MKISLDVSYSIGLNLQPEVPQVVSRRKQLSGCIAALVVGASLVSIQTAEAAPKKSAKNKAQSDSLLNAQAAGIARLRGQLQAVQQENTQPLQRQTKWRHRRLSLLLLRWLLSRRRKPMTLARLL